MALLDLIKNVSINSVMSQNTGLSRITSTTFSMTGTSINSIQQQTLAAVNQNLGNTDYNSQLYSPISQMSSYALANSPSSQASAINSATSSAYMAIDSGFNSSFSSATSPSLFSIQSAATGAI